MFKLGDQVFATSDAVVESGHLYVTGTVISNESENLISINYARPGEFTRRSSWYRSLVFDNPHEAAAQGRMIAFEKISELKAQIAEYQKMIKPQQLDYGENACSTN